MYQSLGYIQWQQVDGKAVSMAYGISGWIERTKSRRYVASESGDYFAQGSIGNVETDQSSSWIHRTTSQDLCYAHSSAHRTTPTQRDTDCFTNEKHPIRK